MGGTVATLLLPPQRHSWSYEHVGLQSSRGAAARPYDQERDDRCCLGLLAVFRYACHRRHPVRVSASHGRDRKVANVDKLLESIFPKNFVNLSVSRRTRMMHTPTLWAGSSRMGLYLMKRVLVQQERVHT